MEALTEVIAGLFALLAAYLAWRLGEKSSKQSVRRDQRREKTDLCSEIYSLFEQAISEILNHQENASVPKFLALNASGITSERRHIPKIFCLLQPTGRVVSNSRKGLPNNGIIQAPDPTAKYKQPANDQLAALQSSLQGLAETMKTDIANT